MGTQSLVLRVDATIARRIRSFLTSEDHGYSSLSEFAEVALLNQIELESRPVEFEPVEPDGALGMLKLPTASAPDLAQPAKGGEPLFVLTNRLSPLKVATRVLANLGLGGRWPTAKEFQQTAAAEARQLGIRLRERDRREGRSGSKRLSIGYPVGKDLEAALDRFIFSFAAGVRDGRCVGPLATLGLANCADDRIALTAQGWALAAALSPLLDIDGDGALTEEEARILREQLLAAPEERIAVTEFVSIVTRAAGAQGRVDELLGSAHPDWSADLTVAHRSAMLGRLGDAGALAVEGRGPTATITLSPEGMSLGERPLEEAS